MADPITYFTTFIKSINKPLAKHIRAPIIASIIFFAFSKYLLNVISPTTSLINFLGALSMTAIILAAMLILVIYVILKAPKKQLFKPVKGVKYGLDDHEAYCASCEVPLFIKGLSLACPKCKSDILLRNAKCPELQKTSLFKNKPIPN